MKGRPTIALLAKRESPARHLAGKLLDEIERRGADVIVDDETAISLGRGEAFPRRKIPRDRKIVVSLGGDGTLLSAARAVSDGAEILGVNLGTLGFLTGVSRREVRSLADDVLSGNFDRDVRRLLEVSVSETRGRPRKFRVLNDAVLNRGALSRIARFTLRFDGKPFSSMRADGL
ncbi:MAG TPA: NAD(+)/NADH kinase, partial [Thermoanaerobaculia bacterium]|nr:NAD(+)/NADH kinase [Thermoanaerobaculia bacterium]